MAKNETDFLGTTTTTKAKRTVRVVKGTARVINGTPTKRVPNTVKLVIPRNPRAAYELGLLMAQYQ